MFVSVTTCSCGVLHRHPRSFPELDRSTVDKGPAASPSEEAASATCCCVLASQHGVAAARFGGHEVRSHHAARAAAPAAPIVRLAMPCVPPRRRRRAPINASGRWASVPACGYTRLMPSRYPRIQVPRDPLGVPDALVAAAAAERGFGVLHYDQHFDRLASVLGFASQWVAPAGSMS
jgi:hypothetical protein